MVKAERWAEVRQAYYAGRGSLRELSERFGVPRSSLERRCRTEGWVQQVAELGGVVKASAVAVAKQQGEELGMTAAHFERRTMGIVVSILSKIEDGLAAPEVDVASLRILTATAKDAMGMGRETLRLDEPRPETPSVRPHLLAQLAEEIRQQRELKRANDAGEILDLPPSDSPRAEVEPGV